MSFELPESRISSMVAPPSGYISYLFVSGESTTSVVSGNMIKSHAEFSDHPLDLPHVAGIDESGQDVDPFLLRLAIRLREVGDHRLAHVREPGDVGAHVTGRVGMDDDLAFRDLRLLDDAGDVVADRLAQAGGVDGHDVGVVDLEDVLDRRLQVRRPAEDRGAFGERARGGHDRVPEVAGQVHAVVGAAALRAVAVGQAAVDAQRGVHGPERLAGLGRVDLSCGVLHFSRRDTFKHFYHSLSCPGLPTGA